MRPAALGDLPELALVERAAVVRFSGHPLGARFAETPTPADVLRQGIAGGRLFAAVAPGGVPVGFALAGEISGNGHLEEVSVHPDHGRRGVGEALVDAVLEWARGRGFSAVTLTTLESVAWNAPWYRKLGFRVLAPDELSRELRALLAEEAERGLGGADRVAMRKELA